MQYHRDELKPQIRTRDLLEICGSLLRGQYTEFVCKRVKSAGADESLSSEFAVGGVTK